MGCPSAVSYWQVQQPLFMLTVSRDHVRPGQHSLLILSWVCPSRAPCHFGHHQTTYAAAKRFPADSTIRSSSKTLFACVQDLLELRSEVADFLQPCIGARGSPGAADLPPTVLAVDVTGDAGDLAALQAALLEVRQSSGCPRGCSGLRGCC
jgi:hypothetical protein